MKRTHYTVMALVLCGCFLLCGKAFSGIPLNAPLNGVNTSSTIAVAPFFIKHSPFNFLFSFESFNHEVCRKPVYLFYEPAPSFDNLNYNSVSFRTSAIGSNYFRVNENITLRKGNTFLLIPHSFTLPVNPVLENLPAPTMTLPRPD